MREDDQRFIRASIEIARNARNRGNDRFGALLVGEKGHIVMLVKPVNGNDMASLSG